MAKARKNLLTKAEFRHKCNQGIKPGLTSGALGNLCNRGKIITEKDGRIDLSIEQNRLEFEKQRDRIQAKHAEQQKKELIEATESKKRLEVEKAAEDLRMSKLKRMKLEGELLPVDIVRQMYQRHIKQIVLAYYDHAQQVSVDTIKRLGGTREDQVKMRKALVDGINASTKMHTQRAKKELEELVAEYSDTRGRGERT